MNAGSRGYNGAGAPISDGATEQTMTPTSSTEAASKRAEERERAMLARQAAGSGREAEDPATARRKEAQRRADERYQAILAKQSDRSGGDQGPASSGASPPGRKPPTMPASPATVRQAPPATSNAYHISIQEKFGLEIALNGVGYQLETWDRLHGGPPDEILPDFMWLGGERDAIFMHEVQGLHGFKDFTHVLFATNNDRTPYQAKFYHRIMVADTPDQDLKSHFEASNQFIEHARLWRGPKGEQAKVLVHCRQGQSRSTTLIVAYFMWHFRCSLKEALEWVKNRRKLICPNTGFFLQLMEFERDLFNVTYNSITVEDARRKELCSIGKINGI